MGKDDTDADMCEQVAGDNNTNTDIFAHMNTDQVCDVLHMLLYVFTTFFSYVLC